MAEPDYSKFDEESKYSWEPAPTGISVTRLMEAGAASDPDTPIDYSKFDKEDKTKFDYSAASRDYKHGGMLHALYASLGAGHLELGGGIWRLTQMGLDAAGAGDTAVHDYVAAGAEGAYHWANERRATIGDDPANQWVATVGSAMPSLYPIILTGLGGELLGLSGTTLSTVGRTAATAAGRIAPVTSPAGFAAAKIAPLTSRALSAVPAGLQTAVGETSVVTVAQMGVGGVQSMGMHAQQATMFLYDHYLSKGMSEKDALDQATTDATGPALLAGAITATLMGLTAKAFGHAGVESLGTMSTRELSKMYKKSVWKTVGRGTLSEMLEEGADETAQGIIELASWNPDKTTNEIIMGGIMGAFAGAILGGGMSAANVAMRGGSKVRDAAYAEHLSRQLEARHPDTEATASTIKAQGGTPEVAPITIAEEGSTDASETVAGPTIVPPEGGVNPVPVTGEGTAATPSQLLDPAETFQPKPTSGAVEGEVTNPKLTRQARGLAQDAVNEGTVTAEEINALVVPEGGKSIGIQQVRHFIGEAKARGRAPQATEPAATKPFKESDSTVHGIDEDDAQKKFNRKGGRTTQVGDKTVETWFDSTEGQRHWVTQVKDADGNQIGDASHSPNQKSAAIEQARESNRVAAEATTESAADLEAEGVPKGMAKDLAAAAVEVDKTTAPTSAMDLNHNPQPGDEEAKLEMAVSELQNVVDEGNSLIAKHKGKRGQTKRKALQKKNEAALEEKQAQLDALRAAKTEPEETGEPAKEETDEEKAAEEADRVLDKEEAAAKKEEEAAAKKEEEAAAKKEEEAAAEKKPAAKKKAAAEKKPAAKKKAAAKKKPAVKKKAAPASPDTATSTEVVTSRDEALEWDDTPEVKVGNVTIDTRGVNNAHPETHLLIEELKGKIESALAVIEKGAEGKGVFGGELEIVMEYDPKKGGSGITTYGTSRTKILVNVAAVERWLYPRTESGELSLRDSRFASENMETILSEEILHLLDTTALHKDWKKSHEQASGMTFDEYYVMRHVEQYNGMTVEQRKRVAKDYYRFEGENSEVLRSMGIDLSLNEIVGEETDADGTVYGIDQLGRDTAQRLRVDIASEYIRRRMQERTRGLDVTESHEYWGGVDRSLTGYLRSVRDWIGQLQSMKSHGWFQGKESELVRKRITAIESLIEEGGTDQLVAQLGKQTGTGKFKYIKAKTIMGNKWVTVQLPDGSRIDVMTKSRKRKNDWGDEGGIEETRRKEIYKKAEEKAKASGRAASAPITEADRKLLQRLKERIATRVPPKKKAGEITGGIQGEEEAVYSAAVESGTDTITAPLYSNDDPEFIKAIGLIDNPSAVTALKAIAEMGKESGQEINLGDAYSLYVRNMIAVKLGNTKNKKNDPQQQEFGVGLTEAGREDAEDFIHSRALNRAKKFAKDGGHKKHGLKPFSLAKALNHLTVEYIRRLQKVGGEWGAVSPKLTVKRRAQLSKDVAEAWDIWAAAEIAHIKAVARADKVKDIRAKHLYEATKVFSETGSLVTWGTSWDVPPMSDAEVEEYNETVLHAAETNQLRKDAAENYTQLQAEKDTAAFSHVFLDKPDNEADEDGEMFLSEVMLYDLGDLDMNRSEARNIMRERFKEAVDSLPTEEQAAIDGMLPEHDIYITLEEQARIAGVKGVRSTQNRVMNHRRQAALMGVTKYFLANGWANPYRYVFNLRAAEQMALGVAADVRVEPGGKRSVALPALGMGAGKPDVSVAYLPEGRGAAMPSEPLVTKATPAEFNYFSQLMSEPGFEANREEFLEEVPSFRLEDKSLHVDYADIDAFNDYMMLSVIDQRQEHTRESLKEAGLVPVPPSFYGSVGGTRDLGKALMESYTPEGRGAARPAENSRNAIIKKYDGPTTVEAADVDGYVKFVEAKQDVLYEIDLPEGWEVNWDQSNNHTKWGTAYYSIKDPSGEFHKVRIGDHPASRAREGEFGTSEYSFELSKPATLESWSEAVGYVENWAKKKNDEWGFDPQLAAEPEAAPESPEGRGAAMPRATLADGINRSLYEVFSQDGTWRWMAMGGESKLRSSPNPKIRALADKLRLHFDTKAKLEGDLLSGLAEIQETTKTNKEFNEGGEEFDKYMAIREGLPKQDVEVRGTTPVYVGLGHNQESIDRATAYYNNEMSDTGKAMVDWAAEVATKTGELNQQLGIKVRDGGKWRPIGNLGPLHFPRMLSQEAHRIIKNYEPKNTSGGEFTNEYQQLLDDMVKNGNAPTTDDAHVMLQQGYGDVLSTQDFLANIELARGLKMPDKYYDTSLKGYTEFLHRWSDRAAQIHAFGQKTDETGPKTAWEELIQADKEGDVVATGLGDKQMVGIIQKIQQGVENQRLAWGKSDFFVGMTGALLLGNPLGSARNLASAYWLTSETFGWWETSKATKKVLMSYLKAANETVKNVRLSNWAAVYRNIKNKEWRAAASELNLKMATPDLVAKAESVGALQHDLINGMILDVTDTAPLGDPRRGQEAVKKVSKYTMYLHKVTERMGRTLNYVAAQQWLRDTAQVIGDAEVGALGGLPMGTPEYLKRVATFQRLGFDEDTMNRILSGDSHLIERFLRYAVREKQFSYDVSQSPLMFYSVGGRPFSKIILQFQRWGFQRFRDFGRNVVAPAVLGTEITFEGKKQTVRDLTPLIRFALLAVGSGELYGLMREWLKDKERTEGSLPIIWARMDDDVPQAVWLAFERLAMDTVMSGHFGIVSDYGMLARDIATRGPRYKDPFHPPSLNIARDIVEVVTGQVQRGGSISGLGDDILSVLGKQPHLAQAYVVGTKAVEQAYAPYLPLKAVSAGFVDDVPFLWEFEKPDFVKLQNARRASRNLRNLARDYAAEFDLHFNKYSGGFTRNPNSAAYDKMNQLLSTGDLGGAREHLEDLTEGMSTAQRKKLITGLKSSVTGRQPLNAYGVTSRASRGEFSRWVKQTLGPDMARKLLQAQHDYVTSAKKLKLMN